MRNAITFSAIRNRTKRGLTLPYAAAVLRSGNRVGFSFDIYLSKGRRLSKRYWGNSLAPILPQLGDVKHTSNLLSRSQ